MPRDGDQTAIEIFSIFPLPAGRQAENGSIVAIGFTHATILGACWVDGRAPDGCVHGRPRRI